jgi:hypothetical protein
MAIDLTAYSAVQTNLFIKIDIPDYDVLYFSDYHTSYTIGSDTYDGLGQLLSVTNTEDSLRAAPSDVTITISGIPSGNVSDILDNRIKGSAVTIHRAFFNVETGALISVSGNPAGKFQGVIANYDITDELSMGSDTGSVVLTLVVTSVVELLNNKISGRRTNPADFPDESAMNRVMALAKSNFQFGAPK